MQGRVVQAEVDAGDRAGTTTEETRWVLELEREVRNVRRANKILKTASAFLATAELDEVIVDYIDAHRHLDGVETPDLGSAQAAWT